jgi:SAM-dependent methyltransferase
MQNELVEQATEPNFFDNMRVDVPALYRRCPFDAKDDDRSNVAARNGGLFRRVMRCRQIPLRYRLRLWRVARRSRLDVSWFEEFSSYWSNILGGRPLMGIDDFCFLKNWYRVKFQRHSVSDDADVQAHLSAWQSSELLYQLLFMAHKQSETHQAGVLSKCFRYHPQPKTLLEFGCATAPILASLLEFYPAASKMIYYISDIQTLAFHYATRRCRHLANVIPVLLRPETGFTFDRQARLDAIFCMAVFEHLHSPLKIVRHFHDLLNPGGLLLCDYIKGDGKGLDTAQAVQERPAALDFMREKFEIIEGQLTPDRSMALTVLRKRP